MEPTIDAEVMSTLRTALTADKTIDIVTTGAKSGLQRTVEIWFMNLSGQIIICGTNGETPVGEPMPRDWLANLRAHPAFVFRLKESVKHDIPADARVVTDPEERRDIMTAPETAWYREQNDTVDQLVAHAPIVEVRFTGEYASLNGST